MKRFITPFILEKENYLILTFTVVYVAAFTFNGLLQQNLEFLYYTFLLGILIYTVLYIHHQLHLASFILMNLSILGFLHLLGGNLYLGESRLYDWYFIEGIFRYDNFVHAYSTFIGTITMYSLLINFVTDPLKKRYPVFAVLLVLMAIGMGTIVELVEFLAVIIFGVEEEVGGYFNNALDLFFNTLGATLATIIIFFYQYRPKFVQRIDGKIGKTN